MSLTYFNPSKETSQQVDASNKGLGAVLLQEGKPIAFASKTLTEMEQRYANIERELLAVVWGAERLRTYLYGCKFQVESNHKPLEMICRKNLIAAPPHFATYVATPTRIWPEHHLSSRQRDNLGRRILPVTKQENQRKDKPQCKSGFCSIFHRKVDTNTSGNKSWPHTLRI